MKSERINRILKKKFSEGVVDSIHEIDQGQFNHVLMINNLWVLRIPRFASQLPYLQKEIQVLNRISEKSPISLPNILDYEYENFDQAFMMYKKIHGEYLTASLFEKLSPGVQDKIVQRLFSFVVFIHGIQDDDLPGMLPFEDSVSYWKDFYDRIRDGLFPRMNGMKRLEVQREFEKFLDGNGNTKMLPCPRHGDLGPTNILFDKEKQEISGVIDFSSFAMGDPAIDLASLSCIGNEFWRKFKQVYQPGSSMVDRINFYRWTFPLQEALSGLENNDQQSFQDGMKGFLQGEV